MADDYIQVATDGAGKKVGNQTVTRGADTIYLQEVVVSRAATATVSNVSSSATSVTLLASNAARRSAAFYNDSTQVLYLKFGATASATSFTVRLGPGDYFEMPVPIYTGVIDGIWVSANGACRVTEIA